VRRRQLSPLDPDALPIPLHTPKKVCHHWAVYRLRCEEYDGLLWRAQDHCEICRRPAGELYNGKLHIDHDSRLGTAWDHVRGLLCAKCNSNLRYVDNGFREPTPEQRRYLDDAWFWTHLPPHRLEEPWLPKHCKHPNVSLSWWDNPNPRPFPWRLAEIRRYPWIRLRVGAEFGK
jgi:hypothetical protein